MVPRELVISRRNTTAATVAVVGARTVVATADPRRFHHGFCIKGLLADVILLHAEGEILDRLRRFGIVVKCDDSGKGEERWRWEVLRMVPLTSHHPYQTAPAPSSLVAALGRKPGYCSWLGGRNSDVPESRVLVSVPRDRLQWLGARKLRSFLSSLQEDRSGIERYILGKGISA